MPVLTNVGQFEDLNDRAAEVLEVDQQTWTGCQINIQNLLGPKFITAHSLHLGKKENVDPMTGKKDDERATYAFTTFLKTKYWLLTGSALSNAITRTTITYDRKWITTKLSGQFAADERRTAWEADVSLSKGDTCFQAKLQGPALGLSYAQPISANYALGTEIMFAVLSDSCRLKWIGKRNDDAAKSTSLISYTTGLGPDQIAVNYAKTVLKNLDVVTELDLSFSAKTKNWESVYKLGYVLKSEQANVKALLTSTGKVVCTLEQPLSESVSAVLSGKIDYPGNVYDFGFGMTMSM